MGRRAAAPADRYGVMRGVVAAALLLLAGCGPDADATAFQGYIEADLVLVGPEESGRLVSLAVEEGDRVAAGQPLFALESDIHAAQLAEAEARRAAAEAELADRRAQRQRPQEIEVIEARRRRLEAALSLARQELERQESLFRRGVVAEARLDQARAAFRESRAARDEAVQQIEAARLAARTPEIAAAEAAAAQAEAAARQAATRLARRRVAAPVAATVEDVYYRPGEIVPAGRPVLALLPPANLRVRFFVPEPRRARLRLGDRIAVACDGCAAGLEARVSFISSQAEYTPPIIFSQEERAKLVFMVEAVPEGETAALAPGQPVDVRPLP